MSAHTQLNDLLNDVREERLRQRRIWKMDATHTAYEWQAILSSHTGQVAQQVVALIDAPPEDKFTRGGLENELIQIAAICLAWIEANKTVPA